MKKIILPILLLFAGFSHGATYVGSVSSTWPTYATVDELNALEAEFNQLINTNGITAAYADAHYLAIIWSNNVLNAQVTASNALEVATNALPALTWTSVSNSVVYTNNQKLLASITNEALWIASSNSVAYTNNPKLLASITNEALWIAASNSVVITNDDRDLSFSNVVIRGNVTLTNTVWDDMSISALQLNSGGAAPQILVYTNGNTTGAGVRAVNYDGGDSAFGQVQFSHKKKRGTDVYPHIHWSTIDNRSAITNISFRLDAIYSPIHGYFTNIYSSTIVVRGTNAFYHQISSFTPFGSNVLNESSSVQFELTCVQDGGANDKLFIHDIDFHYQIDKLGTDEELPPNGL